MRSIRSGALSRFLLYRSPEHWAPRSQLVAFNFFLGFLPFLGALVGFRALGVAAVREIADPRAPLHRLGAPLDAEERRRGVERLGGRLAGGPLCLVVHEHFSDKSWREDWRKTVGTATIVDATGATRPGPWASVVWEPSIRLDEAMSDAPWQSLVRDVPTGGRVRGGCLWPGDRVFLTGCATAPYTPADGADGTEVLAIDRCGRRPPVLTPGATARPRLDELAASLAARTSLLGFAALMLLVYAWRALGTRPFIAPLVRGLRRPILPVLALRGRLVAVVLGPAALLAAICYVPRLAGWDGLADVERYGYAGPCLAGLTAVVLALRMIDSYRVLGALVAGVRAGRAPPLDRLRAGEAAALDAEIDPDASVSIAPLTREERAHWWITTTRVFKASRNHASAPGPETRGPLLVPIVTAGGAALLDLTHAAVDLRAVRHRVRRRPRRPGSFDPLLGPDPGADSIYLIEERFLDPGEPVHVIGRVQRFETVKGGRVVPVLGGVPGDLAVVHAGSRRSLLRHLTIERGYLAVAIPLALAVTLANAALSAYLASF